MDIKLEETILNDYYSFLKEKELENSFESLQLYLSVVFYAIQDNLELACEEFCVPKDLEGIEAQKYIEGEIAKIIQENQRKYIDDLLNIRDSIWKTNYIADSKRNLDDRKNYIKELEIKFNCNIVTILASIIVEFKK